MQSKFIVEVVKNTQKKSRQFGEQQTDKQNLASSINIEAQLSWYWYRISHESAPRSLGKGKQPLGGRHRVD